MKMFLTRKMPEDTYRLPALQNTEKISFFAKAIKIMKSLCKDSLLFLYENGKIKANYE